MKLKTYLKQIQERIAFKYMTNPSLPKSNFPNKNRFVIQAWSNADGWQDTIHGADTLDEASKIGANVLNNKDLWVGGIATQVRIAESK